MEVGDGTVGTRVGVGATSAGTVGVAVISVKPAGPGVAVGGRPGVINSGTVGVGTTLRMPEVGVSSQGSGVPKMGAILTGVGVAVWIRTGVDVGSLKTRVAVGFGRDGSGRKVGRGITMGRSVGSLAGTYSVAVAVAVAASVGVAVAVSMTMAVGSTVGVAIAACLPMVVMPRNPRVYNQVEKRKAP